MNGLGNLGGRDAGQLAAIVRNQLKRIRDRPGLIDEFLAQARLTLKHEPPVRRAWARRGRRARFPLR